MKPRAEPGLYIASTPLIALACAAAARAGGDPARLVLVEDFGLAEQLDALLSAWRDNPFSQIVRITGMFAGPVRDRRRGATDFVRRAWAQRALRRRTLAVLREQDAQLQPTRLWLGNDRRVEMQLALELATRRAGQPAGRFLDDGLYTYLGDFRAARPLQWRVDDAVKRLVYGRWWQRVRHAGTSRWIAQAWLTFPDLAPAAYAQQQVCPLPREWFDHRAFARLCIEAARGFALDRKGLASCDAVCLMPHSSQLRKEPEFAEAMRTAIARMVATGRKVALKYHPRESSTDPGGLMEAGAAMTLPALLPMELMLPWLPRGAVLVGELTTALLAARWLRPDLAVRALGLARGDYALRALCLFERVGIEDLHGDFTHAFARAH